MDAFGDAATVGALAESDLFRAFATDFSRITGLPLSLTPVQDLRMAHRGEAGENPFCALLSQQNASCAACLRNQEKLVNATRESPNTIVCVHGLLETAVPILAGETVIGFLRTGQVFQRAPTAARLVRVKKRLAKWGVALDPAALRAAYFNTKVVSMSRYRSMVGLLKVMADHLSVLSNRLLVQKAHAEPPVIVRAREYIEAHLGEPLSLQAVAKAVYTNRFRLCKLFRAATGIRFSNYVTRLRVEKAKNLLLNPHYSISEVAFSAGFQSLVHFNRSFKKIAGSNPTAYRARLDAWQTVAPLKPNHLPARLETGRLKQRSVLIEGSNLPRLAGNGSCAPMKSSLASAPNSGFSSPVARCGQTQ